MFYSYFEKVLLYRFLLWIKVPKLFTFITLVLLANFFIVHFLMISFPILFWRKNVSITFLLCIPSKSRSKPWKLTYKYVFRNFMALVIPECTGGATNCSSTAGIKFEAGNVILIESQICDFFLTVKHSRGKTYLESRKVSFFL